MARLFEYIAETFANLGAEVVENNPYGLKFTMTGKQYPELVASGIIGEDDTLVLNLDKIRNLKMGEGLDYSDEDDTPKDNSVKVTSVTITDTPAKVTHGDAGFQLNAEVQPDNADNKKISWTSSHPKNAEVNASGYVTIKDYTGEDITIIAKSTDGSNKTAVYRFNMEKAQITGLSLAENSASVQLRQDGSEVSLNIVPMVQPSYAEPYAAITYSSSNANVASVDTKGKVIARSAGSAVITVSAGTYKATFNITVQAAPAVTVAVTGITVTSAAKTYAKGETATVAFTLTPANTTETTVTYSGAASGSVIASNGKGTITLTNIQNSGTLTLTTEKNHKATYNLDARDRVTHISFAGASQTVDQDSSATHEIDKASDVKKSGTVTYASADTNIATVNASTGQVTGKKNGVTTITATFAPAYTGTPITASYEIDVLGLVDFSSAQAFSDSAQGTYEITFFGTKPGQATSGFLKSQTDVPVTTDCDQYKALFNSSNCTGGGIVKNIIVDQANFVGRATISIDNNGAAVIHTKILMTASDMVKNSPNDQYQYSVYRKTISNDPHNQGGTVKGITGRHLTGSGEWGTSTFDVRQFQNNRSKEIILYSKLMGKTIKVLSSN
ncbi:MAG: Ig-like domain-containing protein, partial [Mucispirillum sp.]|nr:Ig-like domain-containing protein [Mucispirillum sp.]